MNLEELKAKTEASLQSLSVEINPHLPTIETLDEVKPKSARDVAGRACAIAYVIGLAYGASSDQLKALIWEYSLWDWVSPSERELLNVEEVADEDKNECSWLAESAQALAWALGIVGLDAQSTCDDDLATKIPFKTNPAPFIESARLRSIDEIQEQVDLHYRLHWWLRQCEMSGVETKFNYGAIVKRRQALDWLYGVAVEWDDISLDT